MEVLEQTCKEANQEEVKEQCYHGVEDLAPWTLVPWMLPGAHSRRTA